MCIHLMTYTRLYVSYREFSSTLSTLISANKEQHISLNLALDYPLFFTFWFRFPGHVTWQLRACALDLCKESIEKLEEKSCGFYNLLYLS